LIDLVVDVKHLLFVIKLKQLSGVGMISGTVIALRMGVPDKKMKKNAFF